MARISTAAIHLDDHPNQFRAKIVSAFPPFLTIDIDNEAGVTQATIFFDYDPSIAIRQLAGLVDATAEATRLMDAILRTQEPHEAAN